MASKKWLNNKSRMNGDVHVRFCERCWGKFPMPTRHNTTMLNFINMCRDAHRDFYIFNEYYEGHGACKLNPIKEGSVTNIADRILNAFTWSEEHYKNLCYEALRDSITDLKDKNQEVSFSNIYHMLIKITDGKTDRVVGYKRKDIQGLLTRIKNINESDFGERLEGRSALSFEDIRKSNKCVYIGLSVLGYAEMARALGKIFLGDLSYSIYDIYKVSTHGSLKLQNPTGVYIDELSAIITHQFVEILNKCRGAKIELNYAFQTPSDISKIDHHLCNQVLESSSNWFIFKQRMEEGANLFAEAIGTVHTKKLTKRVEDGEEKDFGSQREVEELAAHHNIIKNLRTGQAVLLRHSQTQVDLINIKYIDPEILESNVQFLENLGDIPKIKDWAQINSATTNEILG